MVESTRNCPDVSVVVASVSSDAALARCLDSLADQTIPVEIIVAIAAQADQLSGLRSRFPAVRFVCAPAGADVFALRSIGLTQARGRLLALTEDHCRLPSDWTEILRAAHRAGRTVIGGAVDNGQNTKTYDWALYFCEYGQFTPPMPDGPAKMLCGLNVAYDAEALLARQAIWKDSFSEPEVHDALRAAGHELYIVEGAVVETNLEMNLGAAMEHLYCGGLRFGGYRAGQSGMIVRVVRVMAAAVVPWVLTARILWCTVGRRPKRLVKLLLSLPYMLCMTFAWAAGEAMGYLSRATPPTTPEPAEEA